MTPIKELTRTLKGFRKGIYCSAAHKGNFGEDSVQRACFQRIVVRNSDEVSRRSRMPQPDVTSLLPKHFVSQTCQYSDEAVGGNATR